LIKVFAIKLFGIEHIFVHRSSTKSSVANAHLKSLHLYGQNINMETFAVFKNIKIAT